MKDNKKIIIFKKRWNYTILYFFNLTESTLYFYFLITKFLILNQEPIIKVTIHASEWNFMRLQLQNFDPPISQLHEINIKKKLIKNSALMLGIDLETHKRKSSQQRLVN